MKLTNKEKDLIKKVLKDYENRNYMEITKKESDFIFNLIDKLKEFKK